MKVTAPGKRALRSTSVTAVFAVVPLICSLAVSAVPVAEDQAAEASATHHTPLMPYDFAYAVNDPLSGNDFAHQELSDGQVVRGSYRVLLPDSRVQTVTYVSGPNGHVAQVSYSGRARHPLPAPYVPTATKATSVPVAPPKVVQPVDTKTTPYQNIVPIPASLPESTAKDVQSSPGEYSVPPVKTTDPEPTRGDNYAPQQPENSAQSPSSVPSVKAAVPVVPAIPTPPPVVPLDKPAPYPPKTADYPKVAAQQPPSGQYTAPLAKPIVSAVPKAPDAYPIAVHPPKSQHKPSGGGNYWTPIRSEYAAPKATYSAPIKIKGVYSAPAPAAYAAPVKLAPHYGPPVHHPAAPAVVHAAPAAPLLAAPYAPAAAIPFVPAASYSAPKATYPAPVPKSTYGAPAAKPFKKLY